MTVSFNRGVLNTSSTHVEGKSETSGHGEHVSHPSENFNDILHQTARTDHVSNPTVLSPTLPVNTINELARSSDHADNAWVKVVTVLEKLQNPQISRSDASNLLHELSASYNSFKNQSHPIEQLLQGLPPKS